MSAEDPSTDQPFVSGDHAVLTTADGSVFMARIRDCDGDVYMNLS